jgi:hypothetical protein
VDEVTPTTTLYRPVGPKELALIAASGFRAFPPRLPEQPIFYPVLTREYAEQIARDWNSTNRADGEVGYVTRFQVETLYLANFEPKQVGDASHREYWVPAEELDQFNGRIVGLIEVVSEYRAKALVRQDP